MGKIDKNWLASLGITPEDLAKAAEPTPLHKDAAPRQQANHEAISLLRSLTWPYDQLVSVLCWECKHPFLTNYKANVYCSQHCYKVGLERRGIVWRPDRTLAEQWGNLEPPLMIPPGAIEAMRRLVDLADQGKIAQSESPEPDYVPVLSTPEPESLYDLPAPSNDHDIQLEPDSDQDEFLAMLNAL
jgi:hypothetical protein